MLPRGGRKCGMPLNVIKYFYLEFHMSLNSCNTKPANKGVQWGSVDYQIVLCVNFKKMHLHSFERAPVRQAKKLFFAISPRYSGLLQTKCIASMLT